RDVALPLKVFARLHLRVRRISVPEQFPVLIQAPKKPGQPAAIAFEEGDSEVWMILEDADRTKWPHGHHLLKGMGVGVAQHELGELVASLAHGRRCRLMESQRRPQ